MFQSIAYPQARCKLCGGVAPFYDSVDFHKNCEERFGGSLPPSGILIPYYRCPACVFIFATAMDQFSREDFQRWVYNDDYAKVDPEYDRSRSISNAKMVGQFTESNRSLRILDYGAGKGLMADLLRAMGYEQVESFDPMVDSAAGLPQGSFDLILCFEVMEHATDPRHVVGQMVSMLRPRGMILFSTLFQPRDMDQQKLSWWYAAPRNGHVSLFSEQAMVLLAGSFGMRLASFNPAYHMLVTEVPDYARKWFRAP
jgi:2-polyprenyl-6-hydroxyphenyl methylase/3-demethylubiquinone-9 3-methyltransferase